MELGVVLTLDTGIVVRYSWPFIAVRFVTTPVGTRNRTTLYICGTDEYGTATERQAEKEKRSEAALCKEYHNLHKETYDWFDIGYISHVSLHPAQLNITDIDLTTSVVPPRLSTQSNSRSDHFNRQTHCTSRICQEVYLNLEKNGLLEKAHKEQTFCEGCNK
jgi:methionyl-tRNA synthetase